MAIILKTAVEDGRLSPPHRQQPEKGLGLTTDEITSRRCFESGAWSTGEDDGKQKMAKKEEFNLGDAE